MSSTESGLALCASLREACSWNPAWRAAAEAVASGSTSRAALPPTLRGRGGDTLWEPFSRSTPAQDDPSVARVIVDALPTPPNGFPPGLRVVRALRITRPIEKVRSSDLPENANYGPIPAVSGAAPLYRVEAPAAASGAQPSASTSTAAAASTAPFTGAAGGGGSGSGMAATVESAVAGVSSLLPVVARHCWPWTRRVAWHRRVTGAASDALRTEALRQHADGTVGEEGGGYGAAGGAGASEDAQAAAAEGGMRLVRDPPLWVVNAANGLAGAMPAADARLYALVEDGATFARLLADPTFAVLEQVVADRDVSAPADRRRARSESVAGLSDDEALASDGAEVGADEAAAAAAGQRRRQMVRGPTAAARRRGKGTTAASDVITDAAAAWRALGAAPRDGEAERTRRLDELDRRRFAETVAQREAAREQRQRREEQERRERKAQLDEADRQA